MATRSKRLCSKSRGNEQFQMCSSMGSTLVAMMIPRRPQRQGGCKKCWLNNSLLARSSYRSLFFIVGRAASERCRVGLSLTRNYQIPATRSSLQLELIPADIQGNAHHRPRLSWEWRRECVSSASANATHLRSRSAGP